MSPAFPQCGDPIPFEPASAAVATAQSDPTSTVDVLSATLRAIVRFPRDGAGFARIDLTNGAESEFAIHGETLGEVLAATYAPREGRYLVLDQTAGGWWRGVRRLVAVSPTGAAEVLAEWPRIGRTDSFQLATDRSGALWVVAGGRAHHLVLRLERREGAEAVFRPSGFALGAGSLAEAPIVVDDRGVTVPTDDELKAYRLSDLWPAGRRELRRCF